MLPLLPLSMYLSKYVSSCLRLATGQCDLCCKRLECCADELKELLRREKEAGICPDPELDAFMWAEVRTGKRESIVTDFVIKMLGLDVRFMHINAELAIPPQLFNNSYVRLYTWSSMPHPFHQYRLQVSCASFWMLLVVLKFRV